MKDGRLPSSTKPLIMEAMLERLTIHNLAILSNVDAHFHDGFTVLTGETGAGKSLVIDSLSLLLGARASTELIRAGEDKASIQVIFTSSPRIEAFLAKRDIPSQDSLTVERIIGRSKSYAKINGVIVSLPDLQKLGSELADIHSQFDFQKILNPENYLSIIDGLSPSILANTLEVYQEKRNAFLKAKEEYEALKKEKEQLDAGKDFYAYQYQELKALNLYEGEEEEIEAQIDVLKNYDKVYSLHQEANQILRSDYFDQLYELDQILKKLSGYEKEYEAYQEKIDDRYYELSDLFDELKRKLSDMDYDPGKLDELEQRQSDIEECKRKYHRSYSELLEYRDYLQKGFGDNASLEDALKEKEKAKEEAFEEAYKTALELSQIRQKTSLKIEKELEAALKSLLLQVQFHIGFAPISKNESVLGENGIDSVDFLIETNVGEGMKSLSKILSGGEASRIMLAFKALLIKAKKIPTVIFDEIDTGLSGVSAQAVANKIAEISLSTQVISITHMPQVAARSDHQILLSKKVKEGRTYAEIKELGLDEKIRQVAYLISGGDITQKQLDYATEMVMSHS